MAVWQLAGRHAQHWLFASLLACALLLAVNPAQAFAARENARQDYDSAVQAISRGDWDEYRRLRPGLDQYPLAIYLDYFQLSGNVSAVRPADANSFLARSDDTPLPNRFLGRYLNQLGRERRWNDFLAVMPREPNDVELKCYYFRAQRSAGNLETAWEGAARLWVHGKSQPKACDPLFDTWMAAGRLTDDLVWARMLKVFDARQGSLLRYVARKGSSSLQPWSDTLQTVYNKPDSLRRQARLKQPERHAADVIAHGVQRLARYNQETALSDWQHFQDKQAFPEAQVAQVEYAIARQALLSRTEAVVPWLDGALDRLDDDKLIEIRLRWALREQDWAALQDNLRLLSDEGREKESWRYWQAVLLEKDGRAAEAEALFLALAGERGYYPFLAADRLGKPYAFRHQKLVLTDPAPYLQLPAMARIEELSFHEKANMAHSEWFKVLQDNEDPATRQELALVAADQGWHRMAIDAANRASAWDALDLRFPMPYRKTFDTYAGAQNVPSTELMAIARRESAFYPDARSPVGARGLMQIMPATGKEVARSLGARHRTTDLYEVEHNVHLGSAYYRQLLDRYNGNRIFALTAYNAGPHRVDRWRNKGDQGVPVDVWVETIPYRETRNYVQAVLAYNVVFQYLMGDTHRLLTDAERQASY